MKHNPEEQQRIETLHDLLPHTQCQLCGYEGCEPYAKALVQQGESIDRCLPGGVRVMRALAEQLQQTVTPELEQTMREKTKLPSLAVIDEERCIGCTKCIQACPVDAIVGASKQMHTVLTDACNGCELCVPPCPVDCIDMVAIQQTVDQQTHLAEQSKERYRQHQRRLAKQGTGSVYENASQRSENEKKQLIADILKRKR